jgi:hypothetical protein
MTEQMMLTIVGAVITLLVAFAGFILNSIRADIKDQRDEAPKMAEELRGYTQRAADLVREETKQHSETLTVALNGLRQSFDITSQHQQKLWETQAQELATFRDVIFGHEGRISSLEAAGPIKPGMKIRAKKTR